jgi:YVTN family beta-propeller protein
MKKNNEPNGPTDSMKKNIFIEKFIKKNNPKLFKKIMKGINTSNKENVKSDLYSDPITISINQYGVAITPNEQYLYIVNNKYYGIKPPYYNSESVIISYDMIYLYDLINENMVAEINDPSFKTPSTVIISNGRVYVTNADSTTISVIDMATNKVSRIIDGFNRPYRIVINNSGDTGYICNYGDGKTIGTVSVVDLNTYTIIKNIDVRYGPCNCALSIDNKKLCVTNYSFYNTPTINIIDTSSLIVTKEIEFNYGVPFNVNVNNNNVAFILSLQDFDSIYITVISAINLKTNSFIDNVILSSYGLWYGIIFSPNLDLTQVYILNYYNSYDAFININKGIPYIQYFQFNSSYMLSDFSEFNIRICPSVGNAILTYDKKFIYVSNYSTKYRNVNNLVKL